MRQELPDSPGKICRNRQDLPGNSRHSNRSKHDACQVVNAAFTTCGATRSIDAMRTELLGKTCREPARELLKDT